MMSVVTITVSGDTFRAIQNTLRACSTDPSEPERYREWYAEALREVEDATVVQGGR